MANDVYVRLRLKADEFQQELDKSTKKVEEFDESIKESQKGLEEEDVSLAGVTGTLVALGAGALATGLAIVSMTDNLAEGVFEAERYANRLDIATTELIALQKVAKQFGVDAEDVNEGLKNMKERLGEALLEGRGATFDALTKLGINLKEIKELDTKSQFLEMAKALRTMDDAGERTFLTMEIFQEEGFKMAEMLNLSEQEFQKLYIAEKKFADNLNIEAIKEYKEESDRLNASLEKLSSTVGSSFAGVLALTSGFLSEVIDKIIVLHVEFSAWDELQEYNNTLEGINETLEKISKHDAKALDNETEERKKILLDAIIGQEQARIQLENIRSKKSSEQILKETKWYRDQVEIKGKLDKMNRGSGVLSGMVNTFTAKLIKDVNETGEEMFRESEGERENAPSLSPRFAGLLERGSQAEVSARGGEANEMQKQQTQYLKEIAEAQKKRERQFKINNVSF